jgi:oxygen-dependent protoporphyrinogen oxidase
VITRDAIVIGAGIAGLSAAYELHRRQVSFALLERSNRTGGVILSEEVDGYTIDAGPDSLLVQKPEGVRLCEELGLGADLVPTQPPRIAYIQRSGRLHPLPAGSVLGIPSQVRPFLSTDLFTWAGKLRMAGEWFVPPRRALDDESIGAFMTRRFGAEATTYLAEPLLAGIHAGDVNRLSMLSLFPRFVETEREHGSLLRAFRHAAAAPTAPSGGAFRSLPGGLSQMTRALTHTLPAENLRLEATAQSVGMGTARRSYRVETKEGETFESRTLILATPAYVTATLIRPLDAALADLCAEVPYASTGTVALAFRRPDVAHPLNGSGFVVPRIEPGRILAATWLSSKWPHRAPPDRVLMRAFVGGARDPGVLDQTDNDLAQLSLHSLRGLLGISGQPLFTRVYRWPRASAQHEVGHGARMARIDHLLQAHPGAFLTGSGFRGVGIPDCVADGRVTGAQAAAYVARVKGFENVGI